MPDQILKEIQALRREVAELKGAVAYLGFLAATPLMNLTDETCAELVQQGADAIGFCIEDEDEFDEETDSD